MAVVTAKPEHEVLYQDLVKLVAKNADKMTALEVLAVAANMIGKLVAMQDQRTVTKELAIEIIRHNIEMGNQHVLDELQKSQGRA